MKKLKCIVTIFISTIVISSGQSSNELSLHLVSGFFSFGGNTVKPFGNESEISGAIAGQFQALSTDKWIIGMQLGYQAFTSRRKEMYTYTYSTGPHQYYSIIKERYVDLTYKYVSLYPFFGKRFFNQKFNMDITGGLDLGICTTNGKTETDDQVTNPPMNMDVRLVISSVFYYSHFGLSLGYAYGLSNYANGNPELYLPEGQDEIYSRMLRIGMIFRFALKSENGEEKK